MPRVQTATPAHFSLNGLSERERQRLRLLARRYRVRQDTTLRPVADIMFDLRLRHGIHLSMGQVFELLGEQGGPITVNNHTDLQEVEVDAVQHDAAC